MASDSPLNALVCDVKSVSSGRVTAMSEDKRGNRIISLRPVVEGGSTAAIVRELKTSYPFSGVRIQTSRADGFEEVQLIFPRKRELRRLAWRFHSSRQSMGLLWQVSIVMAALAVGMSCQANWGAITDATTPQMQLLHRVRDALRMHTHTIWTMWKGER